VPRQARLDAPGTLHHVMVRGIERRRIVDDELDRRKFVARVGELALATGTKVYAWALLSNHEVTDCCGNSEIPFPTGGNSCL
jgi:hypothetical protein